MNNTFVAGKTLLWFMTLYNGLAGVLLIASGELSLSFVRVALGWTIEGSPTLGVAGEVLGCYLVAFALMLLVASLDPVRYRTLVTIALVFLGLRLAQRVVFSEKVMEVFSVPAGRYWASCAFVALLTVLLGLFRLQLSRAASARP